MRPPCFLLSAASYPRRRHANSYPRASSLLSSRDAPSRARRELAFSPSRRPVDVAATSDLPRVGSAELAE
ncbi:hypothetical protein KC19_6G100300 [Ceratodon purpureus]|uniref:Uncharacterized protein n=1 Tax=Ceratodon purpureus TaxID=3225 RepID=A0A8T0HG18_CERPU|nr:hypothetical protein KC19_6G100300 [Ceratodon purpureus]